MRQYSLCGNPADRSALQVAVLREPAGHGGSAYVHDTLAAGDRLHILGPRNRFRFVDANRYLFIEGGIGVTPLIPMIAEAAARGADWRLVDGGRKRVSMAFRDELVALYGARVDIHAQDEMGLLDLDSLLAHSAEGTVIYCCGPEPLRAAVEECCATWPTGVLHTERFSNANAAEGQCTPFEIELAQSGLALTVPADKSIRDVVEEAGVSVLSSCQEGTCGTCETVVFAGAIDHRDCLLSDDERATTAP